MEQSCKDTIAYIYNLKYNKLQLVNKQNFSCALKAAEIQRTEKW